MSRTVLSEITGIVLERKEQMVTQEMEKHFGMVENKKESTDFLIMLSHLVCCWPVGLRAYGNNMNVRH